MASIPDEYKGREQSWLKHEVLREYLQRWSHKLASRSRHARQTLWYVDCFAGPWNAKSTRLDDTSVSIGLRSLEEAARTWSDKGYETDLKAVFVEKDNDAFQRLQEFLAQRQAGGGVVQTQALQGAFGDHVETINRLIGHSPAFLFVDPTGWKGAAMKFIAPLVGRPHRDVLINVMTSYLTRFKAHKAAADDLRVFFALRDEDVPDFADEREMMEFYRRQLKNTCRLRFAADLSIPNPNRRATHFRLVIGGHSPEVLRVFREVEEKVLGRRAGPVLDEVKRRGPTGEQQLSLLGDEPGPSPQYAAASVEALQQLPALIRDTLRSHGGEMRYGALWPVLLEQLPVTVPALSKLLRSMEREVEAVGVPPRRKLEGDTMLRLRVQSTG